MAERRYQNLPYMVEGMFVVGIKPRSLGEGVVPIVYTRDYEKAWLYWDSHPGHNYSIFVWTKGALKWAGRKMRNKIGITYHTPVPPEHRDTA